MKLSSFKSIVMVLLMALWLSDGTALAQSSMSTEATRFKNNLVSFLREEGFSPQTDGNKVTFKREGESYTIRLNGSVPVKVSFSISGFDMEDVDTQAILFAMNTVNCEKYYVKTYVTGFDNDDNIVIVIEIPCHTAEEFRYVFYDCVKTLASAKSQLKDLYNEYTDNPPMNISGGGSSSYSSSPIEITTCAVANVKKNGTIINDYNSNIYSYQTNYLKPRIGVKADRSGSYTIYYKLITPNGTMSTGSSSPSGYSTSGEINVTPGTHTYELPGWGGEDSGHWSAGTYKFEFYCNGKDLGYYEFKVY